MFRRPKSLDSDGAQDNDYLAFANTTGTKFTAAAARFVHPRMAARLLTECHQAYNL